MNADLANVLAAREARWQRKRALAQNGRAVVSALLRLPRALRLEADFWAVFEDECRLLERRFQHAGLELNGEGMWRDADGPAALWTTTDATSAKALCLAAESEGRGQLMDFDVMDEAGRALSREAMNLPPRTCLVCQNDARLCVRGGAHTAEEVEKAAMELCEMNTLATK